MKLYVIEATADTIDAWFEMIEVYGGQEISCGSHRLGWLFQWR
jgi:hypothetical protein